MRAFSAVLVLGILALSRAAIEEEEDVLVLTDDNFDEAIAEYNPLLVEFYAPWCGHCKRLAPEYAKAATELLENDPPLRIAKVDATANDKLAKRFEIQGFPTLKFFKGSPSAMDYGGGRTAADIVSWVVKKSGPAYQTLSSVEDARLFSTQPEPTVIGFFNKVGEGELFKSFATVAGNTDDTNFAATDSAEAREALEIETDGDVIVLFKEFDGGKVEYEVAEADHGHAERLDEFIKVFRLPLVSTFSSDSASKLFGGPVKTHVLLMADGDKDGFEDMKAGWSEAAKRFRRDALFIWVPPSEDRIMSYFDVTEDDLPTGIVVGMPEDAAMQKFPITGDLSQDNLVSFVTSVLNNEVKPTLKSEEPEDDDLEGPVKVVRGKTFDDIVVNSDHDVLLEFYAPWCGHCKALAPTYEELGTKLGDSEKLTIAKIDATANEVDYEGVNVRGFPTLYFFPASTDGSAKSALEYDGSRDLPGFVSYLKKHATHPIVEGDASDEL